MENGRIKLEETGIEKDLGFIYTVVVDNEDIIDFGEHYLISSDTSMS